jgi:hypothetical protein
MKICFFTVAAGKDYAHNANTLAFTLKKHSKYTLEIFTDFPEVINFGNIHDLGEFNHDNYMFKFHYLKKISEIVKADYYIYIDADSFIVRNFDGIEKIISQDVFHVFLENELSGDRYNWHGKNLEIINFVFNEISKKNTQYYNVNGGFFGIRHDHVDEIVSRAYEIRSLLKNKLTNNFTEEYIISYLAGEYILNLDNHLLHNNFNYFCTDTGHKFAKKLPENKNWNYKEWFGSAEYTINPAIIHCPGNKTLFTHFSKELLLLQENTKSRNKNNKFNFIIACSRPYNLPFVIRSIERQTKGINYQILIVFDFEESEVDEFIIRFLKRKINIKYFFDKTLVNKNSGGNAAKNFAINKITKGWVYQLDDDNLLYPNFIKKILEYINNNPDIQCFIFSQNNRYFPKSSNDIRCGIIDTAMYLLDRNFIGDEKIPEIYGGDGMFIEKLYNKNPKKCLIIDEVLCFYNILEKLN